VEGVAVAGLQRKGCRVVLLGLVQLPQLVVAEGAVVDGFEVLGVAQDGLRVVGDRLLRAERRRG
jgi:hypothetical protein